ncbi:MAG: type II toxin-antitoxin system VapC family toxin [Chloroflexi bacterium]|nr:type II toxin-antitoxin system VapC family toxin [Chloroflexota bacterium]
MFAFLVADDRHHPDAVRAAAAPRVQREALWTIDSVLTELWLLLKREGSRTIADRLIAALLDRGLIREPLHADHCRRAWALAYEWPDQDFSLTDRQAFAAIKRAGLCRAWSYDEDFAIIRIGPRRRMALDLVLVRCISSAASQRAEAGRDVAATNNTCLLSRPNLVLHRFTLDTSRSAPHQRSRAPRPAGTRPSAGTHQPRPGQGAENQAPAWWTGS